MNNTHCINHEEICIHLRFIPTSGFYCDRYKDDLLIDIGGMKQLRICEGSESYQDVYFNREEETNE